MTFDAVAWAFTAWPPTNVAKLVPHQIEAVAGFRLWDETTSFIVGVDTANVHMSGLGGVAAPHAGGVKMNVGVTSAWATGAVAARGTADSKADSTIKRRTK